MLSMLPAQIPKKSRGRPNCRQGCALPVRLAENSDTKTRGFQHAAQDAGGKRGMIDVGVAGDDHIDAIPPRASISAGSPASAGANRERRQDRQHGRHRLDTEGNPKKREFIAAILPTCQRIPM